MTSSLSACPWLDVRSCQLQRFCAEHARRQGAHWRLSPRRQGDLMAFAAELNLAHHRERLLVDDPELRLDVAGDVELAESGDCVDAVGRGPDGRVALRARGETEGNGTIVAHRCNEQCIFVLGATSTRTHRARWRYDWLDPYERSEAH